MMSKLRSPEWHVFLNAFNVWGLGGASDIKTDLTGVRIFFPQGQFISKAISQQLTGLPSSLLKRYEAKNIYAIAQEPHSGPTPEEWLFQSITPTPLKYPSSQSWMSPVFLENL